MRITKDNWKQVLTKGTKIYQAEGTRISKWTFLTDYIRNHDADVWEAFYAFSGADETKARAFSVKKLESMFLYTDYNEAKEQMWKHLVNNLKSVDKIYFDGTKLQELRGLELVLDMGIGES